MRCGLRQFGHLKTAAHEFDKFLDLGFLGGIQTRRTDQTFAKQHIEDRRIGVGNSKLVHQTTDNALWTQNPKHKKKRHQYQRLIGISIILSCVLTWHPFGGASRRLAFRTGRIRTRFDWSASWLPIEGTRFRTPKHIGRPIGIARLFAAIEWLETV